MAFCVVQDDFLDCYGAPEVIGKVQNFLKSSQILFWLPCLKEKAVAVALLEYPVN